MNGIDVFSMYSPAAGSTRVRLYDWLRHLDLSAVEHQYAGLPNAGIATLARNPRLVAGAERAVRCADVRGRTVLMSREASPLSRGGVEERLLRAAAHAVYDFDDALFHDASLRRRVFGGARKFERAVAASDVVLAGNDYLADWASRYATDVRVVPSCVEPSDYVLANHEAREGRIPTIVWLGSGSTEQFLVPLVEQLLAVHEKTGARLKVISSAYDNPALTRLAPMLDRVPWTAWGFAAELAESDVGIAPLDDSDYARGKCAYKILQYGASGLPVVGSPIGANALALSRLGAVSIGRADEWSDALCATLQETATWRAIEGRRAATAVGQHYSFAAWADRWSDAVMGS